MKRNKQVRYIACAAVLLLVVSSLSESWNPFAGSKLASIPLYPESWKQKPLSPWCQPEECAAGHWKPREPAFASLDDLQAAYSNPQEPVWHGCKTADPSGNLRSEEEERVARGKRLVEVMNWVWEPARGKMREWDPEEFMVRMLKSPGGVILLGDSITEQHFHALGYALRRTGIHFHEDPEHLPLYDHKNVHQHILRNDTPIAHRIIERAGIPESRLRRPVFSFLEEHMFIGEREIREITEVLGAPKEYHWYHDFQRVDGWEAFIKAAAKARKGEEDSVTEDTVLVMNAGAHWSRHELSMLPKGDSNELEQGRVTETYRQMLKRIMGRLSPIPQLSIYYRATGPGHPVCSAHSAPYPNRTAAHEAERNGIERLLAAAPTEDEKLGKLRWDWDLFERHSLIWRDAIEKENQALKTAATESARWFYMDAWDQALQRPDAHSEPGWDCLHWCLPSVPEQWTLSLHHLLFLDGQQRQEALSK